MRKNNVLEFQGRELSLDPLTELLRKGAQDLIGHAVELELAELLALSAVVPTGSSIVAHAHVTQHEIDVVVYESQIRRHELVVLQKLLDGCAGRVHECCWLGIQYLRGFRDKRRNSSWRGRPGKATTL